MPRFLCGPQEPTDDDRKAIQEFAELLRQQANEEARRRAEATSEESEYGL